MNRRSFRSHRRPRVPLEGLLLASAVALVLSTLPVSISAKGPSLQWQTALARGGPGGGPGGGGPGGHGNGGGPPAHTAATRRPRPAASMVRTVSARMAVAMPVGGTAITMSTNS
jgi:hypothetical protein